MIEIGPIDKSELGQLAELYNELGSAATSPEKLAEVFARIEGSGDYIVLAAREAGELVGSAVGIICQAIIGQCRPFMIIENIVVSPGRRREGIATMLMGELETIAAQRDCNLIMFVSAVERQDAHEFYASLGYRADAFKGFKKFLT